MSVKLATSNQSLKGVSSVYLGGQLMYGAPIDNPFTTYIDFKQSTYETGSLIWSSSDSTNSPISGTFSALPTIESQSVKFNGTLNLTATYVSQSYAHSDWTVVIYSKNSITSGDEISVWKRGDGTAGNPGIAKRLARTALSTDCYWVLKVGNTNTDNGFNEVSGSTFINDNFVVDIITASGSVVSQYENGVLTETKNIGNASWAWGGSNPFIIQMGSPTNPSTWLKRAQVYNKALTATQVAQVYNDIVNSTN